MHVWVQSFFLSISALALMVSWTASEHVSGKRQFVHSFPPPICIQTCDTRISYCLKQPAAAPSILKQTNKQTNKTSQQLPRQEINAFPTSPGTNIIAEESKTKTKPQQPVPGPTSFTKLPQAPLPDGTWPRRTSPKQTLQVGTPGGCSPGTCCPAP